MTQLAEPRAIVDGPGISETGSNVEYVIAPPGRLVSVNWPELWRYRDLFLVLAWRDIAVRYKQTALGFLWALIQPLVNLVLFTVIFHQVAHIGSGDPKIPYSLSLCVGLVFWQFYSNTLTNSSSSMVTNAAIIQKVYFPRLIVPATGATTSFVDTSIACVILVGMMVYYRNFYPSLLGVLLLPVLLIIAVLASLGLGLFLAALNVKYRDVRYALPFFIQVLMFITPVVYPANLLHHYPVVKAIVLWLNPIGGVITSARALLIGDGRFDPGLLGISAGVSVLFFIGGLYYFRSTERYFADIA